MTEQNQEMYLFLTLGTVFNTIFQGYAAAQRLDMATELFNNLSSYYNELGEDCLREYLDRAFLIAGNLPSKIGDSYVLESIAKHGHMRTDCLSINEINHDWHIRNVSSLACNKDLKLVNQYLTHENSRLKKVIDSKNMAATSPKNLKRLFYLLPPIITVESFKTQYSKVNISEKLLEHANQLREFRLYDGMSYPLATKWNFKVAVFLYIASKLFPTTTVEIACRVLEFYTGLPQEWIKEMIPSHKRYLENKAQHNPALKKENEAIRLLGNRLNYFTPPSNSTNTSVKSTVSPNNG